MRFILIKRALYWRPDGAGYTPHKSEAGQYEAAEALRIILSGDSTYAIPCDKAPEKSRHVVLTQPDLDSAVLLSQYTVRYRKHDPERGWYSLAIWRKQLRPMQLAQYPLCAMHLERGEEVVADVVDHIKPWRKAATKALRWALFIDPSNHQSLCKRCHDSDKARIESGQRPEIGPDGYPVE